MPPDASPLLCCAGRQDDPRRPGRPHLLLFSPCSPVAFPSLSPEADLQSPPRSRARRRRPGAPHTNRGLQRGSPFPPLPPHWRNRAGRKDTDVCVLVIVNFGRAVRRDDSVDSAPLRLRRAHLRAQGEPSFFLASSRAPVFPLPPPVTVGRRRPVVAVLRPCSRPGPALGPVDSGSGPA